MIDSNISKFINKNVPELFSSLRPLSTEEKQALIDNKNRAENWDQFFISGEFNPDIIYDNRFFGIIILEFVKKSVNKNLDKVPLRGVYNSTIGNSIIKGNVLVDHVLYCNNYKIESGVVLHNVGELHTTENSRFGNGVSVNSSYDWMYLINENGGRSVLPFKDMLAADAFIWSKYRNRPRLLSKLVEITNTSYTQFTNCIGIIEKSAEIRNTKIIHDVMIGEFAKINGAEIIENTTIKSTESATSKIGAGVQLQNSIVGYGNHIDWGSQLNYVITGENVSIHQTARITHSYIGDNSSIGCCEIAHSLLFPSHAQHHNNSFLIATMIGGQSNIAAGATIGSNHNSRTNDGEIWASRGFWPGLCTSLKHNSRFASYVMLSKSDYQNELDIPFPFSLVSNDLPTDTLMILPAFWFAWDMYSFMRSKSKFSKRDNRIIREQKIVHDPLAPDTIEEIFNAIELLEYLTGQDWFTKQQIPIPDKADCRKKGKELLTLNKGYPDLTVRNVFEKSSRKCVIINPVSSRNFYVSAIRWYCSKVIVEYAHTNGISFPEKIPNREKNWINCGGQIVSENSLFTLLNQIETNHEIKTWESIHKQYSLIYDNFPSEQYMHALSSLAAIEDVPEDQFTLQNMKDALRKSIPIFSQFVELTRISRAKDYTQHFRKIAYSSDEEMNAVLGNLEDDSVISDAKIEAEKIVTQIEKIICI